NNYDVNYHDTADESDLAVRQEAHRAIARVTNDFDRWSYNTAVAALMELFNAISKQARSEHGIEKATLQESLDILVTLLAPMAPHITAELWEQRHPDRPSVHLMPWPVADPALVAEATVTMVVQVSGKVKARLEVPPSISEEEATVAALADEHVAAVLGGAAPARVVARPPRLVNIIP
ncbi:MAG TPA: class I tRNA ligase family protein, partial [Acidimicrobiales bacterium]|nr:class I tRNA ligase family protein [Acidimicrobiales bacterium]